MNKYLCLYDINNTPLSSKTIILNWDAGSETFITDSSGKIFKHTYIMGKDGSKLVFDGDSEYNGCTYP